MPYTTLGIYTTLYICLPPPFVGGPPCCLLYIPPCAHPVLALAVHIEVDRYALLASLLRAEGLPFSPLREGHKPQKEGEKELKKRPVLGRFKRV